MSDKITSKTVVIDGQPRTIVMNKALFDRAAEGQKLMELDEAGKGVDALAERCLAVCKAKGWVTHNTAEGLLARGGYIHLEVSEFIEALRGKGDSSPQDEAADVLFCLLSLCLEKGIKPSSVLATLSSLCDKLTPPAPEVPLVRTCNRHNDCDAADLAAKAAGRWCADHCHDDCCEDCFGY